MKSVQSKLPAVLIGVLLLGLLIYAFLPKPVAVDVGVVRRGSLRLTVDEDGMTRVQDRFVVSAPMAGRVRRIELEPGDAVRADETVLAVLEPGDPQLLDPRVRAEAEARVKSAEATRDRARAEEERAREAHVFAATEFRRARRMIDDNLISRQQYESAEYQEKAAAEELRAAEFAVKIAEFELEQARAALLHATPRRESQDHGHTPNQAEAEAEAEAEAGRWAIRSPIDGRVLKRYQESSVVLAAGAPLLEVGDPRRLEIIIDVLSTDAVRIAPGTKVRIEHWGGDRPLQARVRLVEPAAFTKISVLGVEEQRVWVVADFIDPPEARATLGDAYRVEARIVVWEDDDVLKVPSSALFRGGESWMVFAIEKGRAVLRQVGIGQNNGLEAEVLDGLGEGDRVVLYPSDRVEDGVAVEEE